jgi:CHAD domain-containing protein
VKPRPIEFDALQSPDEAILRVLTIRFSEMLLLSDSLDSETATGRQHDFRISCKRMRYAIELFRDRLPPAFRDALELTAQLQDTLGEVHDCDVLAGLARQAKAPRLERRIARDRSRKLATVRRMWRTSLRLDGELQAAAALVFAHATLTVPGPPLQLVVGANI